VDEPELLESYIDVESGALPFGGTVLSAGFILSDGAASVGAVLAESIEPPLLSVALSEQAAKPIAAARMKKYFFIKHHFRLKIIAFRSYTPKILFQFFPNICLMRLTD
jgi:hypothetical protein